MAEHAKAPVMADVARLAGVSHQTVSRVINGSPKLRPETRERVQAAIESLGYRPNTAARALGRGRSGMIGIIGTAGAEFGPVSIHRSVEEAARDAGFLASSVNLTEMSRDALDGAVEHLMTVGVEGMVMIAAHDAALEIVRAQRSGPPFVVVEGQLDRSNTAVVGVDQVAGARAATEHLLHLGHREIVHVSGPLDWTEARSRLQGWRSAMHDAGVRPAEPILGDWSSRSGFAAGQAVCDMPDVTAVFTANDQMAIGVLRALHECGRFVPDDVSVIGFDDIPEAEFLIPPLTTVRQDFAAVGMRAIEALRLLMNGHSPTADLLEPSLVVRASTGPPKSIGAY
jgi:DNA-binding LacI/PurR family transcriptional regulator